MMDLTPTGRGSYYLSEDSENLFCNFYGIYDMQEVCEWQNVFINMDMISR